MIAESQKKCTKCGERKFLSEFYETTNGKGWTGRNAACKACCCARIAKRRAEVSGRIYEPRPDDWGTRHSLCQCCGKPVRSGTVNCCQCRIEKNMDIVSSYEYEPWMANADREWLRCLVRCRSKSANKGRQRTAYRNDLWLRKINAIAASCRRRQKQTTKVQPANNMDTRTLTWDECFHRTIKRAKKLNSSFRRRGGWYAKFDTMTRNWRRKVAERSNGKSDGKRVDETIEKPEVQMRIDW